MKSKERWLYSQAKKWIGVHTGLKYGVARQEGFSTIPDGFLCQHEELSDKFEHNLSLLYSAIQGGFNFGIQCTGGHSNIPQQLLLPQAAVRSAINVINLVL